CVGGRRCSHSARCRAFSAALYSCIAALDRVVADGVFLLHGHCRRHVRHCFVRTCGARPCAGDHHHYHHHHPPGAVRRLRVTHENHGPAPNQVAGQPSTRTMRGLPPRSPCPSLPPHPRNLPPIPAPP